MTRTENRGLSLLPKPGANIPLLGQIEPNGRIANLASSWLSSAASYPVPGNGLINTGCRTTRVAAKTT
jgi:hypothetical protein